MSVLKSILHHWNSTSKAYDTLHPETEAAQVTDWHSGIMASLASKTLGTVVNAITTDSVLGKLMKMLLNASGVKYSLDKNGYVKFGSFFGGLIIQWGYTKTTGNISFPVAFSTIYSVQAIHAGTVVTTNVVIDKITATYFHALNSTDSSGVYCYWISMGN